MAAKLTAVPSPTEVAKALRALADELDRRTVPLPDELASKFTALVVAARVAPTGVLQLLEAASRIVGMADIEDLAEGLGVDVTEAALIRDEIAAVRAARRASG